MFAAATATVSGQSKTQPCKPGQLDPGLKECRADQRQVDQGLLLVHSDYRPRLALVEQSQHDDAGGLVIAIGLEGASGDTTRDGGQLHFRGGPTTVTAFHHVSGERRFEAHQRAAQLRLLVGEEALAQQLRALRPAPAPRWSDADIARLERAYVLMQEQMAQDLTLDYLCPQRTLLALRMQRAKLLLENGCQVAQAGWQTGYRHPANFSAAFSRYFGCAPKTVGRAGA